jgi:hypothetical protein
MFQIIGDIYEQSVWNLLILFFSPVVAVYVVRIFALIYWFIMGVDMKSMDLDDVEQFKHINPIAKPGECMDYFHENMIPVICVSSLAWVIFACSWPVAIPAIPLGYGAIRLREHNRRGILVQEALEGKNIPTGETM